MEDNETILKRLKALLSELAEEPKTILNGRQKDELSQPERRIYVRSTFASIEAVIYVIKQIALAAHPDVKCQTITEAERAFAQEQTYKLTDSGDVKIHLAKITLETNIRFSFKLLAKACEIPSKLDVSGPEWQSFQRAINVRDRITHPKVVADLTVSDTEFREVSIAFVWLLASFLKVGEDLRS
jgi:hypothetical protein